MTRGQKFGFESERSQVPIRVEPKLFSLLCTPFCTPYGVLGVPISKVPHFGVHGMWCYCIILFFPRNRVSIQLSPRPVRPPPTRPIRLPPARYNRSLFGPPLCIYTWANLHTIVVFQRSEVDDLRWIENAVSGKLCYCIILFTIFLKIIT